MKVIINFTEEVPPKYKIKEVKGGTLLEGSLITIRQMNLIKRLAGFNLIIEGKDRYFYRPNKDPMKLYYELKRPVESFEEVLMSSLNIIQSIDNSTKEKEIFNLLKKY